MATVTGTSSNNPYQLQAVDVPFAFAGVIAASKQLQNFRTCIEILDQFKERHGEPLVSKELKGVKELSELKAKMEFSLDQVPADLLCPAISKCDDPDGDLQVAKLESLVQKLDAKSQSLIDEAKRIVEAYNKSISI